MSQLERLLDKLDNEQRHEKEYLKKLAEEFELDEDFLNGLVEITEKYDTALRNLAKR